MRQGDIHLHPAARIVRSGKSLLLVLGTSPSRGAMATRADPSRGAAAQPSQALFVGRQPMLASLRRMLELPMGLPGARQPHRTVWQ